MLRTDLDTPLVTAPRQPQGSRAGCLSLCSPELYLSPAPFFGATQCSAQDVAESVRQDAPERVSRRNQHVYTEQDLKRDQILTPEDRAQVERRKSVGCSRSRKSQEAIDARSLPPDAPLGDVARHFRKQKQSQKPQHPRVPSSVGRCAGARFPKPPVMPLRPPVSKPAPPRFAPTSRRKRSPFERPKVFFSAPASDPSRPPALGLTPSKPTPPMFLRLQPN